MLKYVVYCRKSTEDKGRQVFSIQDQITELKKIASRENLNIVDIITESKSAKAPGREKFSKMLELIEEGKINAILVWEMDRLARNPIDGGAISFMLQNRVIKEIRTPYNTYNENTDSTILSLAFGIATDFVRKLRRNVKRGIKSRLNAGFYPTSPPLGYKAAGKGIKLPDDKAHYIRECFELYNTGNYSIKTLAQEMGNRGFTTRYGKKVHKNTIEIILNNPFYHGIIKWKHRDGGIEHYEGNHETLISKKLFDSVQEKLHGKKTKGSSKHTYLFQKKIKCECGRYLRVYTQKTYTYIDCREKCHLCGVKTVREDMLIETLINLFKSITIPSKYHSPLQKRFASRNQTQDQENQKIIDTHKRKLNGIQQRLTNNDEDRYNRDITIEEFRSAKQKLLTEKMTIENKLNNLNNDTDKLDQIYSIMLKLGDLLVEKFCYLKITDQRQVVELLVKSAFFLKDKLKIEFTKLGHLLFFEAFQNSSVELSEIPYTFKKEPYGSKMKEWYTR